MLLINLSCTSLVTYFCSKLLVTSVCDMLEPKIYINIEFSHENSATEMIQSLILLLYSSRWMGVYPMLHTNDKIDCRAIKFHPKSISTWHGLTISIKRYMSLNIEMDNELTTHCNCQYFTTFNIPCKLTIIIDNNERAFSCIFSEWVWALPYHWTII